MPLEADGARTYWLGENGRLWAGGVRPRTRPGIVWGSKVEFRDRSSTDARNPLSALSFCPSRSPRSTGTDAAGRGCAHRSGRQGRAAATPREWQDIFLMDDALARSGQPLSAKLTPSLRVEGGNFARFHVVLAAHPERPRAPPIGHLRELPERFRLRRRRFAAPGRDQPHRARRSP